MKKMTTLILSFFILAFTPAAMATTLGRVDIQQVLITIKEGQKVRTELEKFFNEKQAELRKEEEKVQKMQEDFEKQAVALNDAAKMQRQQAIQQAFMGLQEKTGEYQNQLREREQTLKQPILDRIGVIVEEVSKKADVDMTFEASTAPILYAKTKKDLTDDVIKEYDRRHK
jgi:outer membrane protein